MNYKKIIYLIVVIFFLLGISLYFFIYTNQGLKSIIVITEKFMPALKVQASSGNIKNGFELKKLYWQDKYIVLDIALIKVAKPSFQHWKIIIPEISISKINLNINKFTSSTKDTNSNWYQYFLINKLKIIDFKGNYQGQTIININFAQVLNDQDTHFYFFLNGLLHKFNLNVYSQLFITSNEWYIKKTQLKLEKANIVLNGKWGKLKQFDLDFYIPDLNVFYPEIKGSARGYARFFKKEDLLSVFSNYKIKNFSFQKIKIEDITGIIRTHHDATNYIENFNIVKKISTPFKFLPLVTFKIQMLPLKNVLQTQEQLVFLKNKIDGAITFSNLFAKKYEDINMKGKINILLDDLFWLNHKQIKIQNGQVKGDVNIQGKFKKPDISATFNLSRGSFFLPPLGIHLSRVSLNAHFITFTDLILNGRLYSETGWLNFLLKSNLKDFSSNLQVKGENLSLINLPAYTVIATPNLQLIYNQQILNMTGDILLPVVRINKPSIDNIVTLPDEVIFTDTKKETNLLKQFALDIKIRLGQEIKIIYDSLQAQLAGQIQLTQMVGSLPSATGVLQVIEGQYKIYNKLFTIRDGRLIYFGNLIFNPGLNIKAYRSFSDQQTNFLGAIWSSNQDIQHIKVGVQIQGTLQNPIVHLISDPPLSQDDILSYIVFGQTRDNISSLSALSLLGDLSSNMNLPGPSLMGEASPLSGLFSIFKMGMFNSNQAVSFQLPISRHLRLQTEATLTETGVDFFYTHEGN